jgi:sugar phosphate isomerase/epimerase
MKIGVSSYSFIRLVRSGQMRQIDVISKAKEMGFDVIEFSDFVLEEGETPLSFAPKVKAEAARVGIEVGNYTVGADFINHPGGVEGQAEGLKDQVKAAKLMGAPGMRHDATHGFPSDAPYTQGFEDMLPELAKGCRAVTEFAAGMGIRTMVENHGFIAQDSARVEKLMNAVAHPNFGWLVDIGNFLCADEDPCRAVGVAARYAFHAHAKDFHVKDGMMPDPGEGWFKSRGGNFLRGAIVGHGDVPVLQCLSILHRAGYDGTVSLEFEGVEDPLDGIRIGRDNLKRYIGMVEGQ